MALCLAATAAGQTPLRDFQHTLDSNPLLGFNNAACLSILDNEGFSEAATSFTKENGAVIPIEGSPDSWGAAAHASSFRRLSDRIVFCGGLSYSLFRGQKMGGAILLDPSDNAINFLEETTGTVGTKKRETYSLYGGMSYSFSEKLSAGLRFDYIAADQAKYKDPRFLNVFTDLALSPGVMLKLSETSELGANLIYRHTLEQLSGGLYGTVDTDYDVLVDQGAFFGSKEDFDGDHGYVSTQNIRPLTNDRYGLAIQLASGRDTRFYGQLTALWRTGYYGSKTSTSVVFCEFKGPEAKLESKLDIISGNNLHRFELDGGLKILSNYTNSYEYKATAGMNTTIVYHGQNKTLTRSDITARLAYTLEKNRTGYLPDWVIKANAEALRSAKNTVLYPEYRNQSFLNVAATLSAARNIKCKADCFSIKLDLTIFDGWGNPKTDGSYGGSSKAKSFDDWLNRQFEYDTAARAGAGLEAKWTMLRFKKIAPYIALSDRFVNLLVNPQYLEGSNRNIAEITVGCTF